MKTRNGLFADVAESDWNDWRWQVIHRATTVKDLEDYGIVLTEEERNGIEATLGRLRMAGPRKSATGSKRPWGGSEWR